MQALITTRKCHKTPDGWVHPKTGNPIEYDGPSDLFVISADDAKEHTPIISFMVDRATLEQVGRGVDEALTKDPVVIKRVE